MKKYTLHIFLNNKNASVVMLEDCFNIDVTKKHLTFDHILQPEGITSHAKFCKKKVVGYSVAADPKLFE